MKDQVLADNHTHTNYSSDAIDTTSVMCESAVKKGLSFLTVTDHCECCDFEKRGYDRLVPLSFMETQKTEKSFRGRLSVLTGIELGEPLQDISAACRALGSGDFDFVLASVHSIRGKDDFWGLDYSVEKTECLLKQYFAELQETVEWGRFDSLAHLTYPLRYMVGEAGLSIDMDCWAGRIDEILRALVIKKKALEINTSGYRQKIGVSLPDLPILRRYRELGGKLVTIGSDAHRKEDVGAGLTRGLDVLKKAGFSEYAVYISHQPKMVPIFNI